MNTPFYYWRSTLSPAERIAYDDMVRDLSALRDPVSVKDFGAKEIQHIYNCILDDHCELFYLAYAFAGSKMLFSNSYDFYRPYIYSKAEIASRQSQLQAIQRKIVTLCTGKSDEEKEKILIEHMLQNVRYEIDLKYNQNAATALTEGKGQCSGISRAFKLMCDWVGLCCLTVAGSADAGRGNVGPHGWNIIYLDGKPYQLDVTFLISAHRANVNPYDRWFNCTDDQIKKDHWWDTATPPCTFLYKKNEKPFPSEPSPSPRPTPTPVPPAPNYSQQPVSPHPAPVQPQEPRPALTISVYSAFRDEFKKTLLGRKPFLEFYCTIPAKDHQEWMRYLERNIKTVAAEIQLGGYQMSISIDGDVVRIDIVY